MIEEWRDVPGWEGWYQVSSQGRVRSVDRTITQRSRWGEQTRVMKGRILRPGKCSNAYLSVFFSRPGVQSKQNQLVHRLVAIAFLGDPPLHHEVCHMNGDRTDNRVVNLRWDTRQGNIADKLIHGTDNRGEKNSQSKLSKEDVLNIRTSTLRSNLLALSEPVKAGHGYFLVSRQCMLV